MPFCFGNLKDLRDNRHTQATLAAFPSFAPLLIPHS
jgi:hypothetical protein